MHKVVVERPRWNPGGSKNGRRANLPDELLPKFEGIKRPHVNRKGFTDLLGPLKRWLHAQIGRPWNDVYSEACAVIKPDSVVRAHIKTHLMEYVERHAFMHDGEVCVLDRWRRGGITPVTRLHGYARFFVHPETGLLHEIKPVSPYQWRRTSWEEPSNPPRWLNDLLALKQIKGIWYACQFRAVTPYGPFAEYDHLAGKVVGRGGLLRNNRRYLQCIRKRQLSHRELRKHGLKNLPGLSVVGAQSSAQPASGLMIVLRSPTCLSVGINAEAVWKHAGRCPTKRSAQTVAVNPFQIGFHPLQPQTNRLYFVPVG